MSPTDSHYFPQPYLETTYGPATEADTSKASATFDYDAEAAQAHAGDPIKVERKDRGVFQLHLEETATDPEKNTVHRRTTARSGPPERSRFSIGTSTVMSLESTDKREETEQTPLKKIVRMFLIFFILGIVWIPGILAYVEFPTAKMLGVGMLTWSIWLTIFWAGFWATIAISHITPTIFKSATKVSPHMPQRMHEAREAHKHLGILMWMNVVWISYQAVVLRALPANNPPGETAILTALDSFLFAQVICAACIAIEKVSIQKISDKFHERSYAKRIRDWENVVRALCILYKNTVDVVLRSGIRDSELILGSNPHTWRQNRKSYGEQLNRRGRARAVSEIAGSDVLQMHAPEPFVRTALSTHTKSRLLARRIFYSFSRPGANHIRSEDVAAYFLTPEDAAGAFALFDRDGNGDVSREEIEATCLEFHQEQVAIENSMRDMNAALGQLNGILMSLAYVACAVVLCVVANTQLASLITAICALILGLSWLLGGSLQEVTTSIIFVFAKHPFDVGDSVIIKDECYQVKEIKLLSTIFLDTNSTLVQVSNHQLNNLFIFNIRRSSHLSETFKFDVHYSTTFQEVEKIREKMLEFVNSETRDFQPVFDVTVKDFPGQSRMILSADIKYKSNIVGLKVMRRNKWVCALKNTLSELHICGPTGEPNAALTMQRYTRTSSGMVDPPQADMDPKAC